MVQDHGEDPARLVAQAAAPLQLPVASHDCEQAAALLAGMAAMVARLREALAQGEGQHDR
ncbi:conserved hypothetical protein [Cupriavidus taiwanensis]|uniref:Uncharacterized protein n=1 Tax=Cupriavidus taiwanensis TaxID=164546 RepID=A0A375E8Z4_9BURK|nr:hypothetical protein [Cupriavidus taiwanensis]SOZ18355.1 conserved hypothetical protein [Cupriavidus taiwanensis]SOZ31318.1 conserved hypothetical protein [Cupriavidus taiwanensis]SOZ47396.1 conserved hypothetical protein [Cupriavidus taiwanensis]SOZ67213.1 conserved hypothetical protein [Cupriavidus taiwanensis]SOZ68428.1 conserved hypothetical protein [Cupriavidus taiwanensis]